MPLTSAWFVAAAASVTVVGGAPTVLADRPQDVVCPHRLPNCQVIAEDPGDSSAASPQQGGSGGGGSDTRCYDDLSGRDLEVPCYLEGQGWWSAQYACYLQPADPPIEADDPRWNTRGDWRGDPQEDGENGAAYQSYCPSDPGRSYMWLPGAPDGQPVDLEALAQRAVEQMRLRGPDIGIAPEPGSEGGLVGVPVWMWNAGEEPGSDGPVTESASAGAVTVTAVAAVERIVWDMGDGTSVTCTTNGTPYDASAGMAESPDCGHVYTRTSDGEPGGQYRIVATTTWRVEWRGGGESGVITTERSSTAAVTIGELNVLN